MAKKVKEILEALNECNSNAEFRIIIGDKQYDFEMFIGYKDGEMIPKNANNVSFRVVK